MMNKIARLCTGVLCSTLISGAVMAQSLDEVQEIKEGLTLNATVALADGSELSGNAAVLLLHGTLAHKDMELIKTMQTALAERGINSLAPSLSYGESDRRGMYNCDQTLAHRDDAAYGELSFWKDWLLSKGASSIVLMGHSRGGRHVAVYAADHAFPELTHVAMMAPATFDAKSAAGNYMLTHGQPLMPLIEQAKGMEGDDLLLGVGAVYCKGVDVTAEAFISYHAPDPRRDTPSVIPDVKVPALVIAGSADDVVKGLIPSMEKLANGDSIQLSVIEDADHFFLDFFAEDAADAIEAFIAE